VTEGRPAVRHLDVVEHSWPALRLFTRLQAFVYRRTGGRIGHGFRYMTGKMLLLDHVGAKSGIERTTPLIYLTEGEKMVVVASKGGYPKHPAWFHNLMANPETTIQIRRERRRVRARVATLEERERFWPRVVDTYHGYADFQARSQGREIPLVVFEPR
jgi:deazaflavin-dependent oxidoreductase (nitroreductase family)